MLQSIHDIKREKEAQEEIQLSASQIIVNEKPCQIILMDTHMVI